MHPDNKAQRNGIEVPMLECPECGELAVVTKMTPHAFKYGQGEKALEITTTLPMRVCGKCEFDYYDKEGQEARHAAVCQHLGVMTPAQIRNLREDHDLSRAEFADLTGLGEATIARWERGALIQNIANDRYLSLLGDEKNIERLKKRRATEASAC